MSLALPSTRTISEAWLTALEAAVTNERGRVVHLISTISEPGTEVAAVRDVVDGFVERKGLQQVDTVAETIFPKSLVTDESQWSPDLSNAEELKVNRGLEDLCTSYVEMLPLLLTANGNQSGTYFSRMISWPGKAAGGVNQLVDRVAALRVQRRLGRATYNALDIDISGDALVDQATSDQLRGFQTYAATDRRVRGFPCLTHVDLTLFEGRLHMTALYRQQNLVSKSYGNLLGLSWLLHFIAGESDFDVGELVVIATMADSEGTDLGKEAVFSLAANARAAHEAALVAS